MTHSRIYPIIDGLTPELGQGFNSMTERPLAPPRQLPHSSPTNKENQKKSEEKLLGGTIIDYIRTQEITNKSQSLSSEGQVSASILLKALAEMSLNYSAEHNHEAVEAFLFIFMPMQVEQINEHICIPAEEAKIPGDTFFERGDSYVDAVISGNYLWAALTSTHSDDKSNIGGKVGLSVPISHSIKIDSSVQAEKKASYALTRNRSLIKTNRPDLLPAEEDEKDPLESLTRRFELDAKQRTEEKSAYRFPGLLFQTRSYDLRGDDRKIYAEYIGQFQLRAHTECSDLLFHVDHYLKGFSDLDAALVKEDEQKNEGAALKQIRAELQQMKDGLLKIQNELKIEMRSLSPARLGVLVKKMDNYAINLIERKETLRTAAFRRLMEQITLIPEQEMASELPRSFQNQFKSLKAKGITHLYIEMEGKDLSTFFPRVYEKNNIALSFVGFEWEKWFTFIGSSAYVEIDYFTRLRPGLLSLSFSKKNPAHRPKKEVHVRFYAVHPYYIKREQLRIAIQAETGFLKKIEKENAKEVKDFSRAIIEAEWQRIEESERRWREKRIIKQLTVLPQRLNQPIERTEEMNQLANRLPLQVIEEEENAFPIQVIQGMGGIGKTQLAIEYAHRFKGSFEFVRWILADPQHLSDQWEEFGTALGLALVDDENKPLDSNAKKKLIRTALNQRPSWLIVLDNLENKRALEGLLPENRTATQQVLITSRSDGWQTQKRGSVLKLTSFTSEQCRVYFEARLSKEQCKGIDNLGKDLCYLPLALAHAAAYMQKTQISAEEFQKRFSMKEGGSLPEAISPTEARAAGYDKTIVTTFSLSVEELSKKNPQAANMVYYCGYLHSERIPSILLETLLETDAKGVDECMAATIDYALLERHSEGGIDYFNIHRLVQAAIQRYDKDKEAAEAYDRKAEVKAMPNVVFDRRLRQLATTLIQVHSKTLNNETIDILLARQLEPHILVVSKTLNSFVKQEKGNEASPGALQARLLLALADPLTWSLDSMKGANEKWKRAFELTESILGNEHAQIAECYTCLGNIQYTLGDAQEALKSHEKALAIRIKVHGENHSDVAMSYNNIGSAYRKLGVAEKALKSHDKALSIYKGVYGEMHATVATSYNSIGNAQSDLNLVDKALTSYEKALDIRLIVYRGKPNPYIATSYNNIGNVKRKLNNPKAALDSHRQALDIYSKVYGDTHATVATSYTYIGHAQRDAKKAQEALKSHKEALRIRRKVYPIEDMPHPDIALSCWNIGLLYQHDLNNKSQAMKYFKKARFIYEKRNEQENIRKINDKIKELETRCRFSPFSFFREHPKSALAVIGAIVVAGTVAYGWRKK